jgi:serine/threonine protein kinase
MQPELIGGRYRVETAIGRGGMGTVWLCRDETLQRNVAVKQVGLLPNESVTDSARAFREARSTAALSHRNVVTVFDVVEESGHIWLVMEHVPGRSLSQVIKQDGPLDPGTVAEIGAQVAAGLAAAHAAGTMHRDVKPGNVLIREDGVAKISDFGIARTHGDPALTQSGFLTGTPSYFSPELARGGDPGPGTDVWALGATLYAAVEGHSPYEQRTNPVAVLHDITQGQPPHPQRADFLEPALQRMMDRDPKSRWSMDDAAHVLRRLADQHKPESTLVNTLSGGAPAPAAPTATAPAPAAPTSAREVSREEPSPSTTASAPPPSAAPVEASPRPTPAAVEVPARPSKRPRRRGPARLVLAAAALLLVLGGVAWYVSQLGDGEQAGGTAGQADGNAGSGTDKASSSSSSTDGNGSSDTSDTSPASPAKEKENFVRDYFAKAPGGTDEAWAMLGPSLKEQGRASYNGFWRGIESVDVESAQAHGNNVDVTLVYHPTDGKVSTEHKQEGLVPDGNGGYLLDTDTPAG